MKNKQINFILLFLGIVPFSFWIFKYINVDMWFDEVYSFDNFVMVDFGNPLFNYPLPNNHVFYSFISQILTKLLNMKDLYQIAEQVYLFRFFQVLVTIITAFYSVQVVKRFFKVEYSFLVLTLLFTTIPYLNFSLQLRGYNMSSLFLIMLVYHTWAFIEKRVTLDGVIIIVVCALYIYTIPSNLYMLASVMMALSIFCFYDKKQKNIYSSIYLKAIAFIVLGIGICTILYLPILHDIISNKYASRAATSFFYSLKLFPTLVLAFLSKRYLLVILGFIGSWFFIRKGDEKEKQLFVFLLILLIFPFIFSFFHQKLPYERVFVSLSPIFCVIMSVLILKFFQNLTHYWLTVFFVFVVPIYCTVVLFHEIKNNEIEAKNELFDRNDTSQTIYVNYFLSNLFNQKETVKYLKSISGNNTVILFNQFDQPSIQLYLKMYGVDFLEVNSFEQLEPLILNTKTSFLLTSLQNKTVQELTKINEITSTVISDKYPVTTILRVTHTQ